MLPEHPRAYFITLRTYGTWLPGDPRGCVDRDHNAYGSPYASPDPERAAHAAALLRHAPTIFDNRMRDLVRRAFVDQCHHRGWELIETAVRSNHAHTIVGYAPVGPDRITLELKGRATRWLREARLVATDAEVWVVGGSKRYLWNDEDVAAAVEYVRDGQDMPRE